QADELRRFDLIHIACHVVTDGANPALLFSRTEAPLTAAEIAGHWRLDAELVTLSACETGLGRNVPGEGYLGLAQAFLQAGARNVLASLWSVD
ncbi:CHAT domain-containing protein, partial [Halalkalibacter lacteus]|uniref:CHAT domain-containing protein n=1 Tax=Halalkalibacter lacteus TaxID=3090663 RepID=UPI002FCB955B